MLLDVPGARLYHEVRGDGPTLLLICGGVYDAAGYAGLAAALADRYTVVTYDRRGNSRSPLDGPDAPQSIPVHADDAAALLAETGPAVVFGNSSGGIIGLDLAARYPDRVRALVVHEPPLFDLLPERDRFRAMIDEVEKTFATDGPEAANAVLSAGLDMGPGEGDEERAPGGGPAAEPDPETLAMLGRLAKNFTFFIGYEVPPFSRYAPDYAALREGPVRIVPAAGDASTGEPPHRAAHALGERLAVPTLTVPGDHGGFGQQVPEFAARLDAILRG